MKYTPPISPEITFLLAQLALVESQLLTLKDVTVAATGLTGSGRDNGVQTTSLELLLESGLDLALLGETLGVLLLDGLALLLGLGGLSASLLLTATT